MNIDLKIPTKTARIDSRTQQRATGLTLLTNLTPTKTIPLKKSSHIVP
jgi:hypothetical protein